MIVAARTVVARAGSLGERTRQAGVGNPALVADSRQAAAFVPC